MSKDLQLTPNDSTEIENYLLQAETEQNLIDVEFDKFVSEQAQNESSAAIPDTQSTWYEGGEPGSSGASYMEEYRFDLNGNVIYAPEMVAAYAPPQQWKDYGGVVVTGVEQMMQQCTLNSGAFGAGAGRIPEVCRYFPNCKYGNSCRFFHPESVDGTGGSAAVAKRPQMCRYFPNCNFGDKCVFYHPKQQK